MITPDDWAAGDDVIVVGDEQSDYSTIVVDALTLMLFGLHRCRSQPRIQAKAPQKQPKQLSYCSSYLDHTLYTHSSTQVPAQHSAL